MPAFGPTFFPCAQFLSVFKRILLPPGNSGLQFQFVTFFFRRSICCATHAIFSQPFPIFQSFFIFLPFTPFLVSCSSLLRGGFLHAAGFLFPCCFLIAASVEVRGIVAVCLFKVNRGACYETFCKFQRP